MAAELDSELRHQGGLPFRRGLDQPRQPSDRRLRQEDVGQVFERHVQDLVILGEHGCLVAPQKSAISVAAN
jgi:hypothetical protein